MPNLGEAPREASGNYNPVGLDFLVGNWGIGGRFSEVKHSPEKEKLFLSCL